MCIIQVLIWQKIFFQHLSLELGLVLKIGYILFDAIVLKCIGTDN